jgi:hypothetical protein
MSVCILQPPGEQANPHGEVDARMEAEAALVWAKGRVELDAVPAIELEVALVVLPNDAELDDALGNRDDGQSSLELWVLLKERAIFERAGELCNNGEPCQSCLLPAARNASSPEQRMAAYPCRLARTRALKEGWTY